MYTHFHPSRPSHRSSAEEHLMFFKKLFNTHYSRTARHNFLERTHDGWTEANESKRYENYVHHFDKNYDDHCARNRLLSVRWLAHFSRPNTSNGVSRARASGAGLWRFRFIRTFRFSSFPTRFHLPVLLVFRRPSTRTGTGAQSMLCYGLWTNVFAIFLTICFSY